MMEGQKVGVDLVYMPSFAEKVKKRGAVFVKRTFSDREVEEAGGSDESLAGKFAVKEAFVKTLPAGKSYHLDAIEVLKKEGKPYVLFEREECEQVSISHAQDYVVGVVVR